MNSQSRPGAVTTTFRPSPTAVLSGAETAARIVANQSTKLTIGAHGVCPRPRWTAWTGSTPTATPVAHAHVVPTCRGQAHAFITDASTQATGHAELIMGKKINLSDAQSDIPDLQFTATVIAAALDNALCCESYKDFEANLSEAEQAARDLLAEIAELRRTHTSARR